MSTNVVDHGIHRNMAGLRHDFSEIHRGVLKTLRT